MPPLNEGTLMDMPVTVPRASITEVADDIKARDALLRQFPEIESVIGKAGRADTPTDPAPLEMLETFVNFRPRELWPRRAMKFDDASDQTRLVLAALEDRGFVLRAPKADDRDAVINDATMSALTQFDEMMRTLALQRYREFEQELHQELTRFVVQETIRRFRAADLLDWPTGVNEDAETDRLVADLNREFGPWLARNPVLEDLTKMTQAVARRLDELKAFKFQISPAMALELRESPASQALSLAAEILGAEGKTFAGEVLRVVSDRRMKLWGDHLHKKINWELFDRGVEAYTWAAITELHASAKDRGLIGGAARGSEYSRFVEQVARANHGKDYDKDVLEPFIALRQQLEKPFAKGLILWQRQGGPKGDLLQEIDTVMQVPGWSNIWTQPIANRIDMLATGVRTQIGVKVYGPDLDTINKICKEIEQALKPIRGAQDVVAEQIWGKGYLEINIDRQKAARYGIRVGDIQDTIEVALGGGIITQTIEGRDRFPVRIRYSRSFREDETKIKRLLVSRGTMAPAGMTGDKTEYAVMEQSPQPPSADLHQVAPEHLAGSAPLQIPLSELADVRIVEGPSMIRSENGRLCSYVTLNVRDRDSVGFVEEAQRVVAEKVKLPEGVHIGWSGEFEHQVRASKTLRVIIPAVFAIIFLILYLTYKDLADAGLMMLAVPEALAGGVFFQYFFPKLLHGLSAPPMDFSIAVWVGYIAALRHGHRNRHHHARLPARSHR